MTRGDVIVFKKLFGKPPPPPSDAGRSAVRDIEILIEQKQFPEAANRLRARLRAHPESLGTRMKLAWVLARGGDRPAAGAEYLAVADAYLEQRDLDRAVQTVQLALSTMPANPALMRRRNELVRMRTSVNRLGAVVQEVERRTGPAGADISNRIRHLWPDLCTAGLVAEQEDDVLGLLFATTKIRDCITDTGLARLGQRLPRCYLIGRGAVEARARVGSERPTLTRKFEPGDWIGVTMLLDGAPWPADFRAVRDDTIVFQIGPREMEGMKGDPAAGRLLDWMQQGARKGRARKPSTDH